MFFLLCVPWNTHGLQEGIRGLYKGVFLSMIGIVPYLSTSMTAYDMLKVGCRTWLGKLSKLPAAMLTDCCMCAVQA